MYLEEALSLLCIGVYTYWLVKGPCDARSAMTTGTARGGLLGPVRSGENVSLASRARCRLGTVIHPVSPGTFVSVIGTACNIAIRQS